MDSKRESGWNARDTRDNLLGHRGKRIESVRLVGDEELLDAETAGELEVSVSLRFTRRTAEAKKGTRVSRVYQLGHTRPRGDR